MQLPGQMKKNVVAVLMKLIISALLIMAVNASVKAQPHAPGDIVFTGYHSNPNDKFSFVLLKAFTAGQTINFTDAAWLPATNNFDSDEGLIIWTCPAGGLAAGKELTIDAITNTITLFGGGTAGTISVTTALGLNNGGDQIFAFTGTKAAPTSVLSGLNMNTLSIGEVFDPCNTTDAIWDGTCSTGNNAYSALPAGGGLNTLTGATNALWIGNIAPGWHEWNNARFNCASVPPSTLSTIAGLRAAVNNKANWNFNDDANPNTTLPLPAGCNWLAAICSITLSSAAGTIAQTVCINTPVTSITYSTTSATGATFSGLPSGVTGSWAANVVTISGTPTASGTFNYTVTLTGGVCTSTTATGSITVTPANTVTLTSAPGTNAQTVSVNTPITNITYSTTGATGATFSGLPSGITGSWAANVATISGSPTATGTFNYTVTLTGGCGSVTANGSIVVNPAACSIILTSAAGTNAQTVCINTTIINITYTTTSATGATFSGLPAGVSGVWAANVVTISGTPTVSGTFNYTVTLTGGVCTSTSATGSISVTVNNTITLTSAPGTNAQTVILTAPIANITYGTTGATGATFSGLPGGVTGSWSANMVTISGTPTATGTFNYTVTLTGGCGVITASGSITVSPSGSASSLVAGDIAFTGYHAGTSSIDSFSFVLLKAINAGTLINFTDAGWLNPGQFRAGESHLAFSSIALPAGAEIVIGGPAGLTARWYNYNCVGGIISAGTVTGAALDLNTGGDQIIAYQGPAGSPTSLISIIHMNTYATINFDCANTVAVGLDPNCIDGGTGTIGNGGFSKLPNGLVIGTNSLWVGDATVAAPIGEYDNAKFNGCGLNLSTAALARAAINNQANWLNNNNTPPGFNLPAGCNFLNLCPDPCTIMLTSAAGTNAQTVCINTPIVNITYSTTSATGATFSGLPAGVTGSWASNVVTISGTPTVAGGALTYSVTLTGGICSAVSASGTITVNPSQSANFAYAKDGYCKTGTNPLPIIYGNTGGTFTAPAGLSIIASSGLINVSLSTAGGPYTVTYMNAGACADTKTFPVTISNCLPGATMTDAITIDNGTAGSADPNDRIKLTATISNAQVADYEGMQLVTNNDPRVTLVAGSFKSTPLAVNDLYATTLNTMLTVPVGTGVLVNDFDNNIPGLSVTTFPTVSTQGGTISGNANGSFTYTPLNGFIGNDSFNYTITDSDAQTNSGTAKIHVQ
ncbi:MAG TPA: cadherin-like domain-containing protein [Saprospiraceae bacterium]|nr:cadherin-like domain-containing protein [Saprospiraceae bacterium]